MLFLTWITLINTLRKTEANIGERARSAKKGKEWKVSERDVRRGEEEFYVNGHFDDKFNLFFGINRSASIISLRCQTAISYMAGNGAATMLELALSYERVDPNTPDNEGNTPLHFAAQAGK